MNLRGNDRGYFCIQSKGHPNSSASFVAESAIGITFNDVAIQGLTYPPEHIGSALEQFLII
jgi:hypothetical protein